MLRHRFAAVLPLLLLLVSGRSAFPGPSTAVEEALNGIVSVVDGAINASIGRSLSADSRERFGDSYLDGAREQCARASGAADSFFPCVKFRALRFVHRLAAPEEDSSAASRIVLSDSVHLVRAARGSQEKIFPPGATADDPRSEAYEVERLARFGMRELERFTNSYAVAFRVGDGQGAARLIDEDAPEKGDLFEEARGKKKKLALLVPLLMLVKFIKLKALLIPILFGVLIIKKILILFAIFFPTILGFLRFCKPQQQHAYEYSSPTMDYGSTGYGGGLSYGKENHYSRRSAAGWDAQTQAYRAYAPSKGN